ncbi:TRC8-like [Homarus americanus]|uniref:TRC8-like n=1 Tax=Homarus americanus TaxID=6706 RepID=A0A8J5N507_HOMAM|nr:TRC8-like [Homarus americanus]
MSLQEQALSFIDTALRVPPLFIMDEVLKFSFTGPLHVRYSRFMSDENPFLNGNGFGHINEEDVKMWATENDTSDGLEGYPMLTSIAPAIAKILMFILMYIIATVTFLLSSQRLIQVYLVVASMAVVVAGYQANMYPVLHKIMITSFLMPPISMLFTLPSGILSAVPLFAALLPLVLVKYTVASNLLKCTQVVIDGYHYARRIMRDFGLHSLLESEWVRLNVPNVLRTFWLIRVAHHVVIMLGEFMYSRGEYQSLWTLDLEAVYVIFKSVMTQGCETVVALLGMTSIVSYVSHYVGVAFQMILLTVEDDERSMGTVCAILFFVLAEQSGLTVMKGEKRFVRLCRNFCLLFTAMLHFIHNMVNPVLMSLSASRNPALYRHIRALIVCSLLVFLPVLLLFILWSFYPLSTWLLAVSAFSIQVIVKTLVSLLIYRLFLVDAYCSTFWEKLDDYVYYIKAFGNSVEFVFGILLFFNGAWIYFFESGGSIRAFMMCIHAYFNIWCEARNGWTVFMKRRTAVNKINSLPEATPEQLNDHDDVCAICYQGLHTARITKCNHYFHSVCLRKWLYVQDSCPLCHETLYKTEPSDDKQGVGEGGGEIVMDRVPPDQDADVQGAQPNEDMGNRDIPAWRHRDFDVIPGENTNGPNGEVVIDNEVGEAVMLPPQVQHLEDGVMHRQQERRESQGSERGDNRAQLQHNDREPQFNDNNDVFTLRSLRRHFIDQDIGQQ